MLNFISLAPVDILNEYQSFIKALQIKGLNFGVALEDRPSTLLKGCYKIYFNDADWRIIYRQHPTIKGAIQIIGIGVKSEQFYQIMADRHQIS